MNKRIYIAVAAVFVLLLSVLVILLGVDWHKTVGICYMENTDQSNAAYRQELEQTLMDHGIEIIVASANRDHNKQLSLIQQLLDRRCDALVVEPVTNGYGTELLELLSGSGVPTVLINQQIDGNVVEAYPFITQVGTDSSELGTLQAQMVMDLPDGGDVNGDGVVSYVVLQGPEDDQIANLRATTFRLHMDAGEKKTQMLAVGYGDWTRESGLTQCREQIATYGKDIEVIVCGNDQMALGAAQAITEGGWQHGEHVYLFGIGAEQEALALIRDGAMTGTVSSDIDLQINAVLETVINQLGGGKVSNINSIRQVTVTKENVEQFLK